MARFPPGWSCLPGSRAFPPRRGKRCGNAVPVNRRTAPADAGHGAPCRRRRPLRPDGGDRRLWREDRGRQPIYAKMLRVAIAPGAWQDLGLGRKCRSAPRRCRRSRMATSCRPPGRHPASTGATWPLEGESRRCPCPPQRRVPPATTRRSGSSCRAAARSAATRPGCMRPWRGRTILPDWVAGISIGAINAAIIAGNAPGNASTKLRQVLGEASPRRPAPMAGWWQGALQPAGPTTAELGAASALLLGQPGFFAPRRAAGMALRAQAGQLLRHRRAEGHAGGPGRFRPDQREGDAFQRRRGECPHRQFCLFRQCGNHHPAGARDGQRRAAAGFPAVEIDGEHYWDGGLVSNTPLQYVLEYVPRRSRLTFQVDVFPSRGPLPATLAEVERARQGHPLFQPHPRRHRHAAPRA